MSAPVNATTHTTIHPYMAPGDLATLTVRYDTDTPLSQTFGSASLYKNAITYFSFEVSRGGSQLYFGAVSGNFGQVDVFDTATSGGHDRLTFRLFNDQVDYPSGTRNGTVPMGTLSPLYQTGDPLYDEIAFRDFRMHFHMLDETVLSDEDLPTDQDLAVAGLSTPFVPVNGNTPWSGYWEFTNPAVTLGRLGSFGPGTVRDASTYPLTTSVAPANGGGTGGGTTGGSDAIPEPASLPLMLAGLAGLAGIRRWRKVQAPPVIRS
jgi:hypothetical protein